MCAKVQRKLEIKIKKHNNYLVFSINSSKFALSITETNYIRHET